MVEGVRELPSDPSSGPHRAGSMTSIAGATNSNATEVPKFQVPKESVLSDPWAWEVRTGLTLPVGLTIQGAVHRDTALHHAHRGILALEPYGLFGWLLQLVLFSSSHLNAEQQPPSTFPWCTQWYSVDSPLVQSVPGSGAKSERYLTCHFRCPGPAVGVFPLSECTPSL